MDIDEEFVYEITKKLCEIGKSNRNIHKLYEVEPFRHYFSQNYQIEYDKLDEYDGRFTRREILARYLLVNVVLDQGPDIIGVRELIKTVTTELYKQGVKIFHEPIDLFQKINSSIEQVLETHKSIKRIRAEDWAKENNSNPSKYNLMFAQSMRGLISTKQVLDYIIHRWGVPLCLPLLLEKDLEKTGKNSSQPLVDYLESWKSAEIMTRQLKDHERYGLGSAIGDKACHLFAKLYVSIFNLIKYKSNDLGWTDISYEVPFDSNAGRVLFRTGFLLEWATLEDYEELGIIQKNKGKDKTNYIRVTNIRDKKISINAQSSELFSDYVEIITNYLKIGKRPSTIKIQHVPNLLIFKLMKKGYRYSVADFDDGLIYIGTNYCFNHEKPRCQDCPLKDLCKGYNNTPALIQDYRT